MDGGVTVGSGQERAGLDRAREGGRAIFAFSRERAN